MPAIGEAATILQKVFLPVIANDKCSGWYQSQGKHVVVSSQQFCAGFKEGGKDACRVSLPQKLYHLRRILLYLYVEQHHR